MLQKKQKTLILRFSSFGDIVQTSFVAESLKARGHEVDLLTKSIFSKAFEKNFSFSKVYSFEKSKGIPELWRLAKSFNKKNYFLIYDAHNNQRTLLLKIFLLILNPLNFFKFKTRSKYRLKRFLLFKLRYNLFPSPFKGALSFLNPLNLEKSPSSEHSPSKESILLAPSAAWDLKKWPKEKWIELANTLSLKGYRVSFIGGPQDKFIDELSTSTPSAINLAGKLSWTQTIELIKTSPLLISGDTGVLHIADFFSVPAIALMGPSAFGFPSRKSSKVIYKNLKCQPCSKDGRGKCKNKNFKECLSSITISEVLSLLPKGLKK